MTLSRGLSGREAAAAQARAHPRIVTVVLALAAGVGPALAQPPTGLWLGLSGFAVLIWLLDRAHGARPLRSAFWRGWLAGSAYFLLATWWVWQAFMVEPDIHGWQAPFAVAALAAGLGLFWGAAATLYRLMAPRSSRRILIFAAIFGATEWLRGHVLTGFPWDLPGEAWRAGGAVSQSAALFGVYGLSLVTLAMAASPVLLVERRSLRSGRLAPLLAVIAFAALWGFGSARLALAPKPDPKLRAPLVRIVQANVAQAGKWDASAFQDIVARYVRLTSAPMDLPGRPTHPDIVIWSETAIPALANDYLAPGAWTEKAIAGALSPGQILLIGAARSAPSAKGEAYFNSLIALEARPQGLVPIAIYDKHHLVPFGEYLPFVHLAERVGFKSLAHIGDGFDAGPPSHTQRLGNWPAMAPMICYEALFPGAVRPDPQRAAWIVNVSNDAWFGPTSGPLQHYNMARYRAIEMGLPLARATPTGVSAIVDAYGRPVVEIGQARFGVIEHALPAAAPDTPYDRFGDLTYGLLTLLAVIFGWPGPRALALLRNVAGRRPADS